LLADKTAQGHDRDEAENQHDEISGKPRRAVQKRYHLFCATIPEFPVLSRSRQVKKELGAQKQNPRQGKASF
jgi:hypothetical protein